MNMSRGFRFNTRALILLCALLVSISCTYRFKAPTEFSLPSNKTKIIPLRAALLIGSGYRNLTIDHSDWVAPYPIDYAIGDSFIIGSKKISEILFRDVVVYETMKAGTELPGIDVIVIPSIMEGKFYAASRKLLVARIEVKWTILDTNRKEIYVKTFVGEATGKMKPFRDQHKELGRLMNTAVLEVYTKAFEGLSSVEWWKDIIKLENR